MDCHLIHVSNDNVFNNSVCFVKEVGEYCTLVFREQVSLASEVVWGNRNRCNVWIRFLIAESVIKKSCSIKSQLITLEFNITF